MDNITDKQVKAFSFDLDTDALKKHYKKSDWHNAYNDVRKFFRDNNVEHIQGSVYHTIDKITPPKATSILLKLRTELPWINHCVKSFVVADVPERFDVTHSFKKESNKLLMAEMKEKILKELAKGKSFTKIEKAIKVNSNFDRKTLAMLSKIKQHKDIKAIIVKENEYSR